MRDDHPMNELLARLAAAEPGSAHATSLIALSELDPAAAADWLLEHHRSDGVPLPLPRLARVLATLADAWVAAPSLWPRSRALALLTHFGELLSTEGATELAAAARRGARDAELEGALHAALERAPTHAGLLRAVADLTAARADGDRAHELLSRLGRSDPRLATLQYIHGARRRLPPTDHPAIRIALLSSFTADPLVPFLDLECRELRLEPRVYVAPFNTWEREMLGEGSELQQLAPQVAFLAAAADDLIPELAAAPSPAALEEAGAVAVERLLAAASRFSSWSAGLLVVHSLYTAHRDPLGPAAGHLGPSRSEVLAALNARLADGLRQLPRAYLLDVFDVLARRTHGALDNPKLRHLARMRLGEQVLGDLARAYAGFIAPIAGRTRKCVVVDLDNTLWGGIVGEDGPHGIRLGDTAPGSEYREFQQYLRSLTERGILLAINSKNNEADALEVIREHEAMILREDAFSAMRINWEHKPTNMLSLAQELNIGLDALVFVDDSDKERALMRQALPQVLTPEMPRDPARYRHTLEQLPELQVLAVTDEDRGRTRQYVERRQREQFRVTAPSLEDYLGSLGIVADVDLVSDRTLPRVHQLFQRTNQFNLTGRRYELGVLSSHAEDPTWRIYTTKVRDRFGDHGLVATALVHLTMDAWVIENLVMSCRVIGYGVEDTLLSRVASDAREAGSRWLVGEFVPTAKNAPARDFYARHAFTRDAGEGEPALWRREITTEALTAPAWVTMRSGHGS